MNWSPFHLIYSFTVYYIRFCRNFGRVFANLNLEFNFFDEKDPNQTTDHYMNYES
jgi:hypothetical protein